MKTRALIITLLLGVSLGISAQPSATLYWMDNSPIRHLINPAFQPVSEGYLSFLPLGYTHLELGNNSLSMSDVIYNVNGNTVTALHPDADRRKLLNAIRPTLSMNGDVQLNLIRFGSQLGEAGYFHIFAMAKVDEAIHLPHGMFDFALNGGMQDLDGGDNRYSLSNLGTTLQAYTEVGAGYSHRINEHWEVGGKLKFLMGSAYASATMNSLTLNASAQQWTLNGFGQMMVAAPINWDAVPDFQNLNPENMNWEDILTQESLIKYVLPSGYGMAADLGVVYRPITQLEITAAITDIGFIYWHKARSYHVDVNATYNGVGSFEYSHYVVNGEFNTDSLLSDVRTNLRAIAQDVHTRQNSPGFVTMPTANVNVGLNANFMDRLLSVGVVSNTRIKGNRVSEEVTLGGAVRPCNWFNLALSYSFIDNAKYSNFGAGISLMPYDGINLTLAADYIPTCYVPLDIDGDYTAYLPYRSQGFNLSMGLSIVWGTNPKIKKVEF